MKVTIYRNGTEEFDCEKFTMKGINKEVEVTFDDSLEHLDVEEVWIEEEKAEEEPKQEMDEEEERQISMEQKDFIVGLCSDIMKDGSLMYSSRVLEELYERAQSEYSRAQKEILGYLYLRKKSSAKQSELVAVSQKILNELRKGSSTESDEEWSLSDEAEMREKALKTEWREGLEASHPVKVELSED